MSVLVRRTKGQGIVHLVGDWYVAGLIQGEMLEHFRKQSEERQQEYMRQVFHFH